VPEAEASKMMQQYFTEITAALSRGDGYYELPQSDPW
jgi:hypothetical protein